MKYFNLIFRLPLMNRFRTKFFRIR